MMFKNLFACSTFLLASFHAFADNQIKAPAFSTENTNVVFSVITNDSNANTSYIWSFDDGSQAQGQQVTHRFAKPDRYAVSLSVQSEGREVDKSYHHINVGRSFDATVFALEGTEFTAVESSENSFHWLDCDYNYNIYRGKYTTLWMQEIIDRNVPRQQIINALVFTDFLFEKYSQMFGWDFAAGSDALNTYVCEGVGGAGTGSGGTFLNPEQFYGITDNNITAQQYPDFIHENIHLWDFRGGKWLSAKDTAHAFTAGMEPIINHLLGTGQVMTRWGGSAEALTALPSEFLFNHYYRVALGRYLKQEQLTWESYFGDAFRLVDYDDEDVPINKEQMLVPGGILMSLYQMHGKQTLTDIFMNIEALFQQDITLFDQPDLTPIEQTNNLIRAVGDALQLDVTDYFTYWKYPTSDVQQYLSKYSKVNANIDNDNDGVTRLQGDFDDNDASIYPYAPELIDGKDNNLDGLVDEIVYSEAMEDVTSKAITLPAAIHGELSSLSDVDTFTFTLDEAANVTFTTYAKESKATVPYKAESNRNVSVVSGAMYLNNSIYTELIHDAMSAPETISAVHLEKGTHTIKLAADSVNGITPNPGEYELQVFINEHHSNMTSASLIAELYPFRNFTSEDTVVLDSNDATNITLDAKQISGIDVEQASYFWQQVSGTTADVVDSHEQIATINVPPLNVDEILSFNLVVANKSDVAKVQLNVNVKHINRAPEVNVTPANSDINEGNNVVLTAEATDEMPNKLTYRWQQTSGPEVSIADVSARSISFTAPEVSDSETLEFSVDVSDGEYTTNATAQVIVKNKVLLTTSTTEPSSSGGGALFYFLGLLAGVVRARSKKVSA